MWYTKDGRATVDTSSIYTVGKFDGLSLVIDTYGGRVSCTMSYVSVGLIRGHRGGASVVS